MPTPCFSAPRFVVFIVFTSLVLFADFAHGQKLKPEEVVAKHLESIGSTETRESVSSRIITGDVVVTFREPGKGQLGGRAVMASDKNKNMIGMLFDSPNYPQEKIGYDGQEVTASYIQPGIRSILGNFFLTYKSMVKEGILAGTLSEAWVLTHLNDSKAKLDYSGRKKVANRTVHEIKYRPRGGSDLQISFFFDTENFHHIRTEYMRIIPAQMGSTPESSASQRETRYKFVEDFSDFKKAGGLTLPHTYKITLDIRGTTSSFSADWELVLSEFLYNQSFEAGSFKVD